MAQHYLKRDCYLLRDQSQCFVWELEGCMKRCCFKAKVKWSFLFCTFVLCRS